MVGWVEFRLSGLGLVEHGVWSVLVGFRPEYILGLVAFVASAVIICSLWKRIRLDGVY